jgi:hypothetical protein
VKDEWQPLLAACIIAVCLGVGFAIMALPSWHRLPEKMAVHNQRTEDQQGGARKNKQAGGSAVAVAPRQFFGSPDTDSHNCYQDEKQGDCAARTVQQRIAGLYPALAIAAALQTIAALGTCWLIYRQQRTTRAELRAYVFVSGAKITNVVEGDSEAEAIVVIRNSGKTPAHDLINIGGIAFFPYPAPPHELTITDAQFLAPRGRTKETIGPGDTTISIVGAGRVLTYEQRAAIVAGTHAAYAYGEIRYKDIFNRSQWTRYRMIMGGPAGVHGDRLAGCEEGNDAT